MVLFSLLESVTGRTNRQMFSQCINSYSEVDNVTIHKL